MFRDIPKSKASLLPEFLITRASDFSRAIVRVYLLATLAAVWPFVVRVTKSHRTTLKNR